ncbi:hypothetical protein M9H77_06398 [Catharanthus roseus]|uniref:Uncharacterized protein n=1 Tax=Catharanthus roseus TaxID=4058 RepID=A0ACC0BSE7_CATRO|nr:hypothetical protein M9H77_06398 [Catharanthus roseus]
MASMRYMIHTSAEKTMTIVETPTASTMPATSRSPWHSPVPYLFGGLAAMLGLIAFALLILACSYWRLSGYLESGANNENDLESGESNAGGDESENAQKVFAEKFLVIMPGQQKPTCLATPISSRASSFGSTSSNNSSSSSSSCSSEKIDGENENEEKKLDLENGTMENNPSETEANHEQSQL